MLMQTRCTKHDSFSSNLSFIALYQRKLCVFSAVFFACIFAFQNYLQEIRNLAKFLKLEPSEDLLDAIAEKCRFDRMIVDKEYTKEKREEIFNGPFTMYRKGVPFS